MKAGYVKLWYTPLLSFPPSVIELYTLVAVPVSLTPEKLLFILESGCPFVTFAWKRSFIGNQVVHLSTLLGRYLLFQFWMHHRAFALVLLHTATRKPAETGERGTPTAGRGHQQDVQTSAVSPAPRLPPGGQPDRPALRLHLRVLLAEHCQAPHGRIPARKRWRYRGQQQQQLIAKPHIAANGQVTRSDVVSCSSWIY